MERIKSSIASILIALIMFAGFGIGIMAMGIAIVLGGAFALALRLAGPSLLAKAEKRAEEARQANACAEPSAA